MSDRHFYSKRQPRARLLQTPFRIPDSATDKYAKPRGFDCVVCEDKASRVVDGKPLCTNCKVPLEWE